MSVPRIAVIPVGRVDVPEIEAALGRVAKVLHAPLELRQPATLPKGAEDVARGQHNARAMLAALCAEAPRLKAVKAIGDVPSPPPSPASAPVPTLIFVTDVDLFTPVTDAALGELDPPHRAALVSVRRLREAFYRRKADPGRQRARLVKEILRAAARLAGLPECANADCALASSRAVSDIDRKGEHYCAPCWKRMSSGTMRI